MALGGGKAPEEKAYFLFLAPLVGSNVTLGKPLHVSGLIFIPEGLWEGWVGRLDLPRQSEACSRCSANDEPFLDGDRLPLWPLGQRHPCKIKMFSEVGKVWAGTRRPLGTRL